MRRFYSIICDEVTDYSNIEQLNIRTVNQNLDRHEDFLGFYEVHNINCDTIVAAIKDIILKFNLSFEFYYGKTYDEGSNMVGKKVILRLKY